MENLSQLANLAQIISAPLALVAILISVWLYRRGRQRRALACEFMSIDSPVEIKAGGALKGEIEILYKGKPVGNLFLVRARVRNTGNLPIRKEDTVEPVTFSFEPDVEILRQPDAIAKRPDNLKIGWILEQSGSVFNLARLDFDLLNQSEEFTVEFICTGESKVPKVSARIEGIREIELYDPEELELRERVTSSAWTAVTGLGVALFVAIIEFARAGITTSSISFAIGASIATFLFILFTLYRVFQLARYRRRRRVDQDSLNLE